MPYSRASSCCQLSPEYGGLTRPLCSGRITSHLRSYRAPSQCPASILSPRGCCRLCFSLGIGTTGSRSSAQEPGSESRPLYAGRRLPSHQVPGRLVPGDRNAPGFDGKSLDYAASSKVHFRSSLLIHTCLRYVLNALTPMLTTTALYRSSLGWFEARSWKPTPKGLPSSLMQL